MRVLAIATLMLALAVPASAAFNPAPQIECTYYLTLDRIVELPLTDTLAFHLNPQTETDYPRIVSPKVYVMPGQGIAGHCNIWRNGDEIDQPLSQGQMWLLHLRYVEREARELPRQETPR